VLTTAISAMSDVSCKHLYAIMLGAGVSADSCRLPTPLIRQFEGGKLPVQALRSARPRSQSVGDRGKGENIAAMRLQYELSE
jgi:hypothetical protein